MSFDSHQPDVIRHTIRLRVDDTSGAAMLEVTIFAISGAFA